MANPKGNPQNLKPFPPGNRAGGNKKGSIHFSTRLRRALEELKMKDIDPYWSGENKNCGDQMIAKLLHGACFLNTKDTLPFIKEILDRTDGKPLQTIDQNTTVEFEPDFSGLTREQLDKIYENNQILEEE